MRPVILFLAACAVLLCELPGQEAGSGVVSIGRIGEYRAVVDVQGLKPKDQGAGSHGGADKPVWIESCGEDAAAFQQTGRRVWVIRYSAWKAGDYDLRDLLLWPPGFNKEMASAMTVTVVDPLPSGFQGQLAAVPRPPLNLPLPPAASWRWAAAGLWLAVLAWLGWLAWLRQESDAGVFGAGGDPARGKVMEGLRTGGRGALTPQTRAELQRQFLALLRKDFGGTAGSMKEVLERVQAHTEGGPLLAQFDQWLEAVSARPAQAPEEVVRYLEGGNGKEAGA